MVRKKTSCVACGKVFVGEFIQHESPKDDFPFEYEACDEISYGEDGAEIHEQIINDLISYPHVHEQPTLECNICLGCRRSLRVLGGLKNET